jgi:divalent metal cation (Fe/Co/Zn/Cd) transporter
VIFHCHAAPNLTVAATHGHVDALERALRDRFPEVVRIVGHAEPA